MSWVRYLLFQLKANILKNQRKKNQAFIVRFFFPYLCFSFQACLLCFVQFCCKVLKVFQHLVTLRQVKHQHQGKFMGASQKQRPQITSKPTESAPGFYQDSQVIHRHIKVRGSLPLQAIRMLLNSPENKRVDASLTVLQGSTTLF